MNKIKITSRDRVIRALQHKETDKIPIDLGSTDSSGITWSAYMRLKDHLKINTNTKVYDLSQLLAKVEPEVVKALDIDLIPLLIEPKNWKDWEFQSGTKVKIPFKVDIRKLDNGDTVIFGKDNIAYSRLPSHGFYFDAIYHPLQKITSPDEVDKFDDNFKSFEWPYYNDEDYNDLKVKAEKLFRETENAIVGNLWVHILAAGQELRGFLDFMQDLILNKGLVHKILNKQLDAYLERIDKYLDAVGEYLSVIQVNDDLGTQNGLQISKEIYREMIKPYHKKLWGYIKDKSKKPILLHSCGSVYDLIPDFIEMGVDALNPVQVSAAKMNTARLKKEFGKDISFWGGGCDTQKVLPNGSPELVREEVRRRIDDLAPGGGFIFCQVHNIQPDVPVENIMAMYDELKKYS